LVFDTLKFCFQTYENEKFHKSVFVCSFSEFIKVVNMAGKLKSSRKQAAELHFDSPVESLGMSLISDLITLLD